MVPDGMSNKAFLESIAVLLSRDSDRKFCPVQYVKNVYIPAVMAAVEMDVPLPPMEFHVECLMAAIDKLESRVADLKRQIAEAN